MQPHYPYVNMWKYFPLKYLLIRISFLFHTIGLLKYPHTHHLEMKRIGVRNLSKMYLETLLYVLNEVKDLSKKIRDKIVITSDHGELLGEHGKYGHSTVNTRYPRYKELITVPWLEIDLS